MTDPTNFRQERIEKLLQELRYEIERGMMQREIGEETFTEAYLRPQMIALVRLIERQRCAG